VKRVLITDYVHHSLITGFTEAGYKVNYAPEAGAENVKVWLPGCVGLVVNTKTVVDRVMMDRSPELEFIGRLGVGLDTIDVEEAEKRGIRVVATPGANANAVAEHMFGMLLALLRNFRAADHTVREGHWIRERHRGRELGGLTVGVIGYGNTGSAFASKFVGWKTQVLTYDKYKEHYAEGERLIRETDLETLIAESDIISLHVPLTDETYHMIDEGFLQKCKPGVIILNGSRGKVVDTIALADAIDTGRVGGAALDVLENEKLNNYSNAERLTFKRLLSYGNVILTPHIAGWTDKSKLQIARQILLGVLG